MLLIAESNNLSVFYENFTGQYLIHIVTNMKGNHTIHGWSGNLSTNCQFIEMFLVGKELFSYLRKAHMLLIKLSAKRSYGLHVDLGLFCNLSFCFGF